MGDPADHLSRGEEHFWASRFGDAAVEFAEARAHEPENSRVHFRYADALFRLGRLAEAETALREAVRHDPENADAHFLLGEVREAQGTTDGARGSFSRAAELYRHAVKTGTASAHGQMNLGRALAALGDLPSAEASLRDALRGNPERADVRLTLAQVLEARGLLDDALQQYGTATSLYQALSESNPGHPWAETNVRRGVEAQERLRHATSAQAEQIGEPVNDVDAALASGSLQDGLFRLECLARDLGLPELASWCSKELRGYAAEDWPGAIPAYRHAPVRVIDGSGREVKVTPETAFARGIPVREGVVDLEACAPHGVSYSPLGLKEKCATSGVSGCISLHVSATALASLLGRVRLEARTRLHHEATRTDRASRPRAVVEAHVADDGRHSTAPAPSRPCAEGIGERPTVFVCYSRRDRRALERLQTHLAPQERDGLIDRWDDTRIRPGQQWEDEIRGALSSAKAAVLLVSPDFLASDYIANEELPRILSAAAERGLLVLTVFLQHCLVPDSVLRYQGINSPDKPLSRMRKAEKEKTWAELTKRIADMPSG